MYATTKRTIQPTVSKKTNKNYKGEPICLLLKHVQLLRNVETNTIKEFISNVFERKIPFFKINVCGIITNIPKKLNTSAKYVIDDGSDQLLVYFSHYSEANKTNYNRLMNLKAHIDIHKTGGLAIYDENSETGTEIIDSMELLWTVIKRQVPGPSDYFKVHDRVLVTGVPKIEKEWMAKESIGYRVIVQAFQMYKLNENEFMHYNTNMANLYENKYYF